MLIYKTINLLNNKFYVGKDCNNNPYYLGSGLYLLKAIKKYGRRNFKKEILEFCDLDNINQREIYWIEKLQARKRGVGYNIAKGGHGKFGVRCSAETKRKLSLAEKGKPKNISDESRAAMSILRRGNCHSEETKRKISKANKGKIRSLETRLVASIMQRGKRPTIETRLKMSAARKGHVYSEAQRRKLSALMKGRIIMPEWRKKIAAAKRGKKNPHSLYIYKLLSPDGVVHETTKLIEFCEQHGLHWGTIGARIIHCPIYYSRGWRIERQRV